MDSFVPEDLERYKASRKGKVKDVSINNEIRTIKAAFQKAVDWNRLKAHPFKNVKQIRVAQKKTPSFTMEQFKKGDIGYAWNYDQLKLVKCRYDSLTTGRYPHAVDKVKGSSRICFFECFSTKKKTAISDSVK